MHSIIIRLKSGREIKFVCKTYTFERSKLNDKLLSFEYTGGVGECPIYFNTDDIELILETIDGNGEV